MSMEPIGCTPLDADEFLTCEGGRAALEDALASGDSFQPASIRLQNYLMSDADDCSVINPVLRDSSSFNGIR